MKILKLIVLSVAVAGLIFFPKPAETETKQGQAASYGEMAGDIVKGKALFNDPAFGGSTNENSCNTCHSNGRGLEKSGDKKEFNIMGMKQNSLEEAVNTCIENPLKGKAIDPKSEDMINIIAYIKSLGKE